MQFQNRNIVNKAIPLHLSTKVISTKTQDIEIPDYFNWADSGLLRHVEDQGSCGCCWAIASLAVFADRISIKTNGAMRPDFDVVDLMQCALNDSDWKYPTKDNGCCGGFPDATIHYLQEHGIIDNGENETFEKWCDNSPCCNKITGVDCCSKKPEKGTLRYENACKTSQMNRWYVKHGSNRVIANYENDKINMDQTIIEIKKELMTNGPLLVCFMVFKDFMDYGGKKPYVYDKISENVGGHAIEVVGWKTVNGIPCWIFKNSWGTEWGIKGYGYFAMTDKNGRNIETSFEIPTTINNINSGGMIAFDVDDARSNTIAMQSKYSKTAILIGGASALVAILVIGVYLYKNKSKSS